MTSTVKVNNVQASDGGNIINQCGTNITIGASGDTIALASGASQTGFGRTGTVDWNTTPKTATFTAVSGEGYFCNTAGGSFEVDLPAGSAGAIVSIQDYNNTFDSYSLTVDPNGSEKINGGDAGISVELSTEGLGITFVYVDSTVGWRSVHSNEYSTPGLTPAYVAASGGNSCATSGNYKYHIFTGPGTFTVSNAGNSSGSNTVSYMVIAGGGGGGRGNGGGGGAGGYRESKASSDSYTASPLNATCGSFYNIPVSATPYPITAGGGGAGNTSGGVGTSGNSSVFSTVTSAGGGGGGANPGNGLSGGSGGGGGNPNFSGGAGNTPPVSPPQGKDGGDATASAPASGGGGGAGTAGGDTPGPTGGGNGGNGVTTEITASPVARAGGGGGGVDTSGGTAGTGGTGGGGAGTKGPGGTATAGTANTGGGGGGGGGGSGNGGAGGSGVVVIRYRYQ